MQHHNTSRPPRRQRPRLRTTHAQHSRAGTGTGFGGGARTVWGGGGITWGKSRATIGYGEEKMRRATSSLLQCVSRCRVGRISVAEQDGERWPWGRSLTAGLVRWLRDRTFSGVWCGAHCPLVSLCGEFPQLGGESPCCVLVGVVWAAVRALCACWGRFPGS